MAKVVYICVRNSSVPRTTELKLAIAKISKRICPDNITPRPAQVIEHAGIIAGIFSPSSTVVCNKVNICLGFLSNYENWDVLGRMAPEGAYVIFRANQSRLQIVTDAVGSRPAWYYIDDNILITGTSQRAIIALLKSFEFNTKLIPWLLVSGTPGPENAWDRRVRRVGADTILTLDRGTWTISLKTRELAFRSAHLDEIDHRNSLRNCLQSSIGEMRFDYSKWALALSGGYDSRGLLFFLPNPERMNTITWGLEFARSQKGNDAAIASEISKSLRTTHQFFQMNISADPLETIFNRFVVCGEGGIDHIAGYMDGFDIWRQLHDSSFEGIIRGDTCFAAKTVSSEADVRHAVGLWDWADFENLPPAQSCGIEEQDYPIMLDRRASESLEQWRDRLRQCFRIPVWLAALNELKTHYIEIANPLIVKRLVDHNATIPDDLRTEKVLFKSLFDNGKSFRQPNPDIPFARSRAISTPAEILGSGDAVAFLRSQLGSDTARSLLPEPLLKLVGQNLRQYQIRENVVKRQLMNLVGSKARKRIRKVIPARRTRPVMNFNKMAFRIFIICRMHNLLMDDAVFVQK